MSDQLQVIEGVPHHCAPWDIAALVDRLEALADPQQEAMPSFADTDWRTLSSVCHRVISYLVDLAATPTFCDVCGGAATLEDIEQYRLQMAGISTAALGYWKESDGIHPDYDTVPLRDVAKLYAKYEALYSAAVRIEGMDPEEQRADDLGRAAQIASAALHFIRSAATNAALGADVPVQRPAPGIEACPKGLSVEPAGDE